MNMLYANFHLINYRKTNFVFSRNNLKMFIIPIKSKIIISSLH